MVNSKPNIMPPATASAKQESSSGEASQAKVVSEGRASAVPQVIVNVPNSQLKDGPAEILNAVAAVLWPLVIALVVIMFREQIISLARRVRNAKAFGAEAEFEKELEALNREANKAKEEAGVNQGPQQPEVAADAESSVSDDVRSSVLAEAARVPRLGLMLLSAEVDKLARRIAASSGHHGRRSTLREQLEVWDSQLPNHTSAAYRLFAHVRNRIVHGSEASEQEILSAIDSGLVLYDALSAIPIEVNVVAHPDVDIFSDPQAMQLSDGKGLIIKSTHAGNTTFRIYPTTQRHYVPGMRLTWEWNMNRIWGNTWYRDPESGEIMPAWNSSAEFVGGNLDQI